LVHESNSRLAGFYKLSPEERLESVARSAHLTANEAEIMRSAGLDTERADRMIENVIGTYELPLGIATNMQINGRDHLVPMAVEEPSVVAGLSYAAKLVRQGGGFHATTTASHMIGQIQIMDIVDPAAARLRLLAARDDILNLANAQDPIIVGLGGGAREIEVRFLPETPAGPMLVLHLIYDTLDAMGANTINTALEAIASPVAELTGGRTGLRILSNLADRRLVRAWGTVPKEALAIEGLTADEGVQRLIEAYAFAATDPYRAATHNKGIMNGIDAVAIASGQDWRAIEAGAHAYAARTGRYTSLSTWERDASGNLVGSIEMPMPCGTVGGATKVHPKAQLALKIMGVSSAHELAQVIAAAGLGQNLAAIRALAMEGIQRGHMRLHARQVAMAAGAEAQEVAEVVARLEAAGIVRLDRAQEILAQLRGIA